MKLIIKYGVVLELVTLSFHNTCSDKMNVPPNIIFILTDDQRLDTLGYEENQILLTPKNGQVGKGRYIFQK